MKSAGNYRTVLRPDRQTLRRFGFFAAVGFCLLAVMAYGEVLLFSSGLGWARVLVAALLVCTGALAAVFSLTAPRANLPIYLAMVLCSYPMGLAVSYALMAVLFFGLLTPLALFLRLVGRDSMNRRLRPEAKTYWMDPRTDRTRSSYFRQF